MLILFSTLTYAQLEKGFYRVHNYKTERYVYVYDNTGKINISTTSADMGAIQLWKDHSRTISDPASVIYVEPKGNNKYNLHSQGTSVVEIIGYHVMIYAKGDSYQLYAEGKYLADEETTNVPDGQLGTVNKGDYRKWVAVPVDQDANYFGIAPNLTIDDTHYEPFFADFAFSFANEGMKAYYVSETYKHIAVIKEIKDEFIAANTPVIIGCGSNEPSSNKLNLFTNKGNKINDNMLKGVYFNNARRPKSKDARTKYDANTMRVLGTTAEGKLGFVISKDEYLAANEAYLSVPADSPEEFVLMTEEELAAYKETEQGQSISTIKTGNNTKGVFSVTGVKVADKIDGSFPKGIYIVDGKKIIIQ